MPDTSGTERHHDGARKRKPPTNQIARCALKRRVSLWKYENIGLGNRCSIRSWHLIAEHSGSRFRGQAALPWAFGSEFSVKHSKLDCFAHFFRILPPQPDRERSSQVVDWLKTLENHTANLAGRNDEMATYNFNWLWTELDV
jgi:hypothetical protein